MSPHGRASYDPPERSHDVVERRSGRGLVLGSAAGANDYIRSACHGVTSNIVQGHSWDPHKTFPPAPPLCMEPRRSRKAHRLAPEPSGWILEKAEPWKGTAPLLPRLGESNERIQGNTPGEQPTCHPRSMQDDAKGTGRDPNTEHSPGSSVCELEHTRQ